MLRMNDGRLDSPVDERGGLDRSLRQYFAVAAAQRSGSVPDGTEPGRLPNLPRRWREPDAPC